jgi:hypothetical protein
VLRLATELVTGFMAGPSPTKKMAPTIVRIGATNAPDPTLHGGLEATAGALLPAGGPILCGSGRTVSRLLNEKRPQHTQIRAGAAILMRQSGGRRMTGAPLNVPSGRPFLNALEGRARWFTLAGRFPLSAAPGSADGSSSGIYGHAQAKRRARVDCRTLWRLGDRIRAAGVLGFP